jgi:hypothetical protein
MDQDDAEMNPRMDPARSSQGGQNEPPSRPTSAEPSLRRSPTPVRERSHSRDHQYPDEFLDCNGPQTTIDQIADDYYDPDDFLDDDAPDWAEPVPHFPEDDNEDDDPQWAQPVPHFPEDEEDDGEFYRDDGPLWAEPVPNFPDDDPPTAKVQPGTRRETPSQSSGSGQVKRERSTSLRRPTASKSMARPSHPSSSSSAPPPSAPFRPDLTIPPEWYQDNPDTTMDDIDDADIFQCHACAVLSLRGDDICSECRDR